MQASAPQRITVLGEPADLITCTEVIDFLAERAAKNEKGLVANHNAHSIFLVRRRPQMRAMYDRADLIELDSQPLIGWARFLGKGARPEHRCTYLDWRYMFWERASERGWKVFFLGGAQGVAKRASGRLYQSWPGMEIATHPGFFDMRPGSKENEAVIEAINAFKPHVILIGMGMPRQELWVAENYDRLETGVVLTVGAAFDYEAGVQKAAPRWMGRFGVEWLYRLFSDPKRLASRYLLEPWALLPSALRDVLERLGWKRRPRGQKPGKVSRRRKGGPSAQACPPEPQPQ